VAEFWTSTGHDEAIARHARDIPYAAAEVGHAMRVREAAGIPMGTDRSAPVPAWTDEQRDPTVAVANAWRDLWFKRDVYAGLLRDRAHLYPDADRAT